MCIEKTFAERQNRTKLLVSRCSEMTEKPPNERHVSISSIRVHDGTNNFSYSGSLPSVLQGRAKSPEGRTCTVRQIIKAEDEASDLPESVRPEETYEDVFKPSFRMKSNWRSNRGKRNSDHIVLNKFTEWFEASGGSKLAQVPAFPLDPEHPLRPGHLLIYTYSPFTRDCLQVWLRMAGHLGNDLWQEVGEGYKSTFITGQPRYLVILNDNTPYWKTEESYRKHKK
ncbi:hypothetical protein SCHPADRAFT_895684 [Schizopora paradoxa]|uniref:Uncharacterized protein n=1 Tax=Schizopora paradoxa TaxID=27342 RepID=A0A0H2R2X9_9AGAM|nr:hypothetical protein SCHPADRAFT_895684 [Schizopora paradoxa]